MVILRKTAIQYLLACLGIAFLLASPSIIYGAGSFAGSMASILQGIFQPGELTYYIHSETRSFPKMPELRSEEFHQQIIEKELFPTILEPYFYSLLLLTVSLVIAVLSAAFMSLLVSGMPLFLKKILIKASQLLEALPDVFFIFSLQLAVVWTFKKTGWEIASAYSTPYEQVFLLPLLALSIVPAIYMFRLQLLLMEEEGKKEYILYAKSKGLSNFQVSFQHVFRNTIMESLAHLPGLILLLFTNLVIIEFLFNSYGMISFIIGDHPAPSRTLLLILLMTPFFLLVKGTSQFRDGFYQRTNGGMKDAA